MKILITGANGFIGQNLIASLHNLPAGWNSGFDVDEKLYLMEYDMESSPKLLEEYTKECDFVFHLAGVNRPKNSDEFMEGNAGLTENLLNHLKNNHNKAPVLITSSIQAELDNAYGISKKVAEEMVLQYGKENGVQTFVYRLPNVFGKWCRPNYNSVVATFAFQIARDIPITIHDPAHKMQLVYIDDVITEFLLALTGKEHRAQSFCYIPTTYETTVGEIAHFLHSFRQSRNNIQIPCMEENSLEKKLYSTYLSYLPENMFSYALNAHIDARGSFTELFRSADRGQVSVNITKPGIIKGNHWHHTKTEKFVVISGHGVIRLRKIQDSNVIEYFVDGEKPEVIDIPPGYTHQIVNNGSSDLITVIWCSECYDPNHPDTYFLEI